MGRSKEQDGDHRTPEEMAAYLRGGMIDFAGAIAEGGLSYALELEALRLEQQATTLEGTSFEMERKMYLEMAEEYRQRARGFR